MKTLAAAIALLLAGAGSLHAQPAPFDMSPERPSVRQAEPQESDLEEETAERAEAAAPATEMRRFLLADGRIFLSGETAARAWGLHLTQAQAASPVRLRLGYRNSLVVAPEASRLQLLVNGTLVIDEPVRSADGFSELAADLPEGLLRAGRNDIAIRAWHRHRTDCTIASTYDLWSEIDPSRSYLSFADPAAATLSSFEDLRTLGPDAEGRVRVSIVAPAITSDDIRAEIMRLAQAVALHINLPDLDFSVHADPAQDDATLRVLLGSADELAQLGGNLGITAPTGPVAAFLPAREGQPATLLVSGRNREDWTTAIERMTASVDRPVGQMRDVLVTEPWQAPDAPMIYGARDLSLAELGIRSEQFSGRRHTADFRFAVPADFFADSYGEARLLIDAARSEAVLPGSLINVYVNGSIASATPIVTSRGGVIDRRPINLTMRHFLPGLNHIRIETILVTQQDAVCLPGATADTTTRFALFDTSRFVVPDFARIGRQPDLAAFGGVGFPYGQAQEPVAIVTERADAAGLSAAANMLARMALSAGRSIRAVFTASADAARSRDAIFIAPINGVPAGVLGQVGVTEESRTAWNVSHGQAAPADGGRRADAEAWRRELEGRGWFGDVRNWFSRTFEITADMLRFAPRADVAFTPSDPAILMVAQGLNPAGNGVWTLATAPDAAMLEEGMKALTDLDVWRGLSGHLLTLESDLETVHAVPATRSRFTETRPPSFGNYRLVVANWLSSNILSYALVLVLACLMLGIATSMLMSRLGRRS